MLMLILTLIYRYMAIKIIDNNAYKILYNIKIKYARCVFCIHTHCFIATSVCFLYYYYYYYITPCLIWCGLTKMSYVMVIVCFLLLFLIFISDECFFCFFFHFGFFNNNLCFLMHTFRC